MNIPSMKQNTVLLAEDHTILRECLRRILELEDDLQVLGEAQDGREAVALSIKLRPDVVLMDISMPLLNGLEATRQILKALPATKVLILSAHSEAAYVKNASEAGAFGFLLKETSACDISRAIRQVQEGEMFFSSQISGILDDIRLRASYRTTMSNKKTQLTSREVEVLQLIAEGETNKQIAAELAISIKTVEKHRQAVRDKLNIDNTASLTRYAISAGIIECGLPLMALR